jgi:C1A family cysteine protease
MAATGAHDWDAARHAEDVRAAESLWWATVAAQGHTRGADFASIAAALEQSGQPAEATWPYPRGKLSAAPDEPPLACGEPPWRTVSIAKIALKRDGYEAAIEATIRAGRPVIIVLKVTDDFDQPNAAGLIAAPSAKSPSRGNHAVLAVGLSELDIGERHLLIRNSWGPRWAVSGYAFLPTRYLATHGVWAAAIPQPV